MYLIIFIILIIDYIIYLNMFFFIKQRNAHIIETTLCFIFYIKYIVQNNKIKSIIDNIYFL